MRQVKFIGAARFYNEVSGFNIAHAPLMVFAGRSNVGKSSLLNVLTDSKVARVAAQPGKTRMIMFYEWHAFGKDWILVDLPGYGYAQVSQSLRKEWGKEITQFLLQAKGVEKIFVLVDGRHGYFPQDLELIDFLNQAGHPFVVVFTKMDKWKSKNQRRNTEKTLSDFSNTLNIKDYFFVSISDGKKLTRLIK